MKNIAARFYAGTLISSVGPMTLTVCLVAFMVEEGYPFFQIGVTVGLARIVPMIINFLAGELADVLSPRRVILWSEIAAGFLAFGLYASWLQGPKAYVLFLFMYLVRSSVLTLGIMAGLRMGNSFLAWLLSPRPARLDASARLIPYERKGKRAVAAEPP